MNKLIINSHTGWDGIGDLGEGPLLTLPFVAEAPLLPAGLLPPGAGFGALGWGLGRAGGGSGGPPVFFVALFISPPLAPSPLPPAAGPVGAGTAASPPPPERPAPLGDVFPILENFVPLTAELAISDYFWKNGTTIILFIAKFRKKDKIAFFLWSPQ